jgi:hypothetical protein
MNCGRPESAGPQQGQPSAEELIKVSEEVAACFPQPFEQSELVLMVIDPHHIHAYWSIAPGDLEAARREADSGDCRAPLVLRLYDITLIDFTRQDAHSRFDLAVHGLENTWYVELWQDAKSLIADLGLRRQDGSLARLARSNVVQTPRGSQSPYYERAGLRLGRDGKVEEVPDVACAPAAEQQETAPIPGMDLKEVERQVRRHYGAPPEPAAAPYELVPPVQEPAVGEPLGPISTAAPEATVSPAELPAPQAGPEVAHGCADVSEQVARFYLELISDGPRPPAGTASPAQDAGKQAVQASALEREPDAGAADTAEQPDGSQKGNPPRAGEAGAFWCRTVPPAAGSGPLNSSGKPVQSGAAGLLPGQAVSPAKAAAPTPPQQQGSARGGRGGD